MAHPARYGSGVYATDTYNEEIMGSWYELLSIYQEAEADRRALAAIGPIACPHDGEPLTIGPDGRKFCKFDGWRPLYGESPRGGMT